MRRHPLTMDEITQVFHEELTARYHQPSEAQLTVLLFNLSGGIARLDVESFAALRPLCQAAADFSHYGWQTHQAIEAIARDTPGLVSGNPCPCQNQGSFTGGGGGGAVGANASAAETRERATIAARIGPVGIFRRNSSAKVRAGRQPVAGGLTYEHLGPGSTPWRKIICATTRATCCAAGHLPDSRAERSCVRQPAGEKFESIHHQGRASRLLLAPAAPGRRIRRWRNCAAQQKQVSS